MPIKKLAQTKAFTLIELLVVMVIIGILLGVSVAGFRIYQANTSLQSAVNDFTTVFRNARNNAQNNSVYRDSTNLYWTFSYGFQISGTQLKPFWCRSTVPQINQTIDDYNNGVSNITTQNVNILNNPSHTLGTTTCVYSDNDVKDLKNITLSDSCSGLIGFQTVTGTMYTGNQAACTVKISLSGQGKNIVLQNNSSGDFTVQ